MFAQRSTQTAVDVSHDEERPFDKLLSPVFLCSLLINSSEAVNSEDGTDTFHLNLCISFKM